MPLRLVPLRDFVHWVLKLLPFFLIVAAALLYPLLVLFELIKLLLERFDLFLLALILFLKLVALLDRIFQLNGQLVVFTGEPRKLLVLLLNQPAPFQ